MKRLIAFLAVALASAAYAQPTIDLGNNAGTAGQCPTGTTCADTAAPGTNNRRVATTAFVIANSGGAGIPALAQNFIFVGNASNLATAVAMSGDCSIVAAGAITCTKTGGVSFATVATSASASDLSAGTLAVARGGTGLGSGTSGGVLAYTASGTLASSAALGASRLVLGGGAGAVPTALGSLGTTTTVLHGNAAGAPTFGAVALGTDVSGTLPATSGGTGLASGTSGGIPYFSGTTTIASSALLTQFGLIYGGGAGAAPVAMAAGTDGQLIVGQTGAAPLWKTASGDWTIAASGASTIAANVVTDAKLRQSAGFSVIGRSASTTGNVADITAVSADQVLRVNQGNTAINFGPINLASTSAVTGILALANGGTNANLTASNGGILYSTASAGAILAGTATARQMLQSGASTTPAWSTATWPATTTANQLLYSSSTNVVGGLTAGSSGQVLLGATGSAPVWTKDLSLGAGGTGTGTVTMSGTTSGSVTMTVGAAAGSGTWTLPGTTDTVVGKATTDTFTNKTYDTTGTGNAFKLAGTTVTTISTMLDTLPAAPTVQGTLAYRSASGWSALAPSTAGRVLTTNGAGLDPSWTPSSGTGTVTSLSQGAGITLSTSPITTTGTISVDAGQIPGTTTNDSATAGNVGEYKSATTLIGSEVSLSSGNASDVATVSLSAGDWDVSGIVCWDTDTTTNVTGMRMGINSSSGTMPTTGTPSVSELPVYPGGGATLANIPCGSVPSVRISLSGAGNGFLIARGLFTVSFLKVFGSISARRVR